MVTWYKIRYAEDGKWLSRTLEKNGINMWMAVISLFFMSHRAITIQLGEFCTMWQSRAKRGFQGHDIL